MPKGSPRKLITSQGQNAPLEGNVPRIPNELQGQAAAACPSCSSLAGASAGHAPLPSSSATRKEIPL
ncbi:Hypothetical predicted protein [Podarcis lilfordi]|uniref:Uncharacterized protein n=1 Tax=Podarcis lilfordi TaxID=74358 RepID=A0AA35LJ67_9SAUR|nr:Hypothetical predicted protein [Podarcis lilfordi]